METVWDSLHYCEYLRNQMGSGLRPPIAHVYYQTLFYLNDQHLPYHSCCTSSYLYLVATATFCHLQASSLCLCWMISPVAAICCFSAAVQQHKQPLGVQLLPSPLQPTLLCLCIVPQPASSSPAGLVHDCSKSREVCQGSVATRFFFFKQNKLILQKKKLFLLFLILMCS